MTAEELLARYGLHEQAATQLEAFAAVQRWYMEREAAVAATRIDDAAVLSEQDDRTVLFVVLHVEYDSGVQDRYQVSLGVLPGTAAGVADQATVVAQGGHDDVPVVFVDALSDPDCAAVLWNVMASHQRIATTKGELYGRGPLVAPVDTGIAATLRPLGREQSNTSLVRDDREVLKCFRRLEDGITPELEMTEALTASGFAAVPTPLGVIEYTAGGQSPTLLALLQPYFHNGTEGWALALTSLRDLYACAEDVGAADGDAMQRTVAEQGATFLPDATRLGETIAEMHLALTSPQLPEAMRPLTVDAPMLRTWAADMTADLDQLLERQAAALDGLRQRRQQVVDVFDAITQLSDGGLAIRVHGDLHLGQALRTDTGWTVLDFEGEPIRRLDVRRLHSSPLRDVAGMLRSFDYAAAAALSERSNPADPDWATLLAYGDAWSAANKRLFWGAYLARIGTHPLLPDTNAALTLRRAFELHKAVYEAEYELGHRPDWVTIPLRFLLREIDA